MKKFEKLEFLISFFTSNNIMIKVSDWSNSFFSKTTLNKYSYKELKISDKMNIIFYNRCPLHDHNIMEMVWYMKRERAETVDTDKKIVARSPITNRQNMKSLYGVT